MTNDFDKNGYVHLKEFLDKDNCKDLTNELKRYIEQGQTTKDDQCPKSEAVHGSVTFDKLLEDLLPHFENACGKKLLPTYSYARLYKPGEKLNKHTDRPACEISATVTLGFDGDVWSIYMAGNKVDMQVGDAVLYRGMDVEHWREEYTEGQWQAQVFLHYVDANGKYKDQKYDGRTKLAHHSNILPDFIYYSNILSDNFCNNIIKTYSDDTIEKEPPYISGDSFMINKTIRDVDRVNLNVNTGLPATLNATAITANQQLWQYNITHFNQSELLIYKPNQHYIGHTDTIHIPNNETRKLTALAFLNDDYEGGKFYILTGDKKQYPPQEKGTIVIFPSYIVHGVEPVTKGIRYSCVSWLVGPYFK